MAFRSGFDRADPFGGMLVLVVVFLVALALEGVKSDDGKLILLRFSFYFKLTLQ